MGCRLSFTIMAARLCVVSPRVQTINNGPMTTCTGHLLADAPVSAAESREVIVMVAVLTVIKAVGVIVLSMRSLVVLKTNKAPDSRTVTAGSDVVQSGRPIFDDFFQHLWPYIGNNTANVVFQMVKRLWIIRIDQ
ncbi:hypothetical protein TNCV_4859811 [Trichonephila clavipes]|nr:hypothetical protein TNCV_4859811 [Trichonephila clavipes]